MVRDRDPGLAGHRQDRGSPGVPGPRPGPALDVDREDLALGAPGRQHRAHRGRVPAAPPVPHAREPAVQGLHHLGGDDAVRHAPRPGGLPALPQERPPGSRAPQDGEDLLGGPVLERRTGQLPGRDVHSRQRAGALGLQGPVDVGRDLAEGHLGRQRHERQPGVVAGGGEGGRDGVEHRLQAQDQCRGAGLQDVRDVARQRRVLGQPHAGDQQQVPAHDVGAGLREVDHDRGADADLPDLLVPDGIRTAGGGARGAQPHRVVGGVEQQGQGYAGALEGRGGVGAHGFGVSSRRFILDRSNIETVLP
ncbi:hypothetical protein NBM05_07830 [Rothia sp. AR01]|uniref:Uncharacterized protein n=1 Tax=Rothia santali TaxID=2949643 RepID=A0A9X2KI74_9MICC|nr:hypothetical protein [Rothia santali]MCP3425918.1 hypothetical protein [Rothia santali]